MVPAIHRCNATHLLSTFFSTTLDMSVNVPGTVEIRDIIPQMLIMNVEAATHALELRGEQGNVWQEGGSYCTATAFVAS
jgi:hypothetical protein